MDKEYLQMLSHELIICPIIDYSKAAKVNGHEVNCFIHDFNQTSSFVEIRFYRRGTFNEGKADNNGCDGV